MDPNLFYAFELEKPGPGPPECRDACESCPVREDCLGEALKFEPWGFYGGTTAAERRAIRKRRHIKTQMLSGVTIFNGSDELLNETRDGLEMFLREIQLGQMAFF